MQGKKIRKRWKSTLAIVLAIMIVVSGLALFVFFRFIYRPLTTLHYTETKEDVINPERGFYIQMYTDEIERLAEPVSEGMNLVLAAYDMKKYLDRPLDEEKLLELDRFLEEAKSKELKVIFRAAYDYYGEYEDPESMELILNHISQISEVLNRHKEVLLCVQAGFFGPWGEWHSSNYLQDEKTGTENRNAVLKKLLEVLDPEILLNVRRPQFIRDAKDAGLDTTRIGIHNDAFLSTEDDMGTYSNQKFDRQAELNWMEDNLSTGINGGEMPAVSEFNNAENAVKEMRKMQTTYLNSQYNKDVLERWKTETYTDDNAFDYIKAHLGYRLSITEMNTFEHLRNGRAFTLIGTLLNTGFAPMLEHYEWSIVIDKGNQKLEQPLDTREIKVLTGNQSGNIQWSMKLPNDFVAEEEIRIGIQIKGNDGTSYVRLANEEIVFEDNTNYFMTYRKVDLKEKTENSVFEKWKRSLKSLVFDSVYYKLVK